MQKSQQVADEILAHGCLIPRLSFVPPPTSCYGAMGPSEEEEQGEEGRAVKNEYKNSKIEWKKSQRKLVFSAND